MNPFVERHQEEIGGVLSCFDRVVITGTLPDICHPKAMAGYLNSRDIRLFDYARWAEPPRDEVRANAERLVAEAGLEIEFIRKLKAFRKEDRVQSILAARGHHPGLVHIFSAMEACSSYRPASRPEAVAATQPEAAAPAEPPPTLMSAVDVKAHLEELAAANPQKLNWKTSIVDLLKLLDLDSSFAVRKELATELGCPPELMRDSAQMNIWLHKAVLQKIADNGGNIPAELLE